MLSQNLIGEDDLRVNKAAMNTIRASWVKIRMAKLFGKKKKVNSIGFSITLGKLNGVEYLIDKEEIA